MTTRDKTSKGKATAGVGTGQPPAAPDVRLYAFGRLTRWKLQDAKNSFSEVVQQALDGEPQCVSRHGKDAVIVIGYDAFVEAVQPRENLADFFLESPLAGLNVDFERVTGDYREVDL